MMRIFVPLVLLLIILAACTGSVTTATTSLTGNWNVVLTAFNQTAPLYTFGLQVTQTGSNLSATTITYTGNPNGTSTGSLQPVASDPCFSSLTLTGTGTVTGATANSSQSTANGTTITTPSFPQTLMFTLADGKGTTLTLNGTYEPSLNLYQGNFASLTSTECANAPSGGQMVMGVQPNADGTGGQTL